MGLLGAGFINRILAGIKRFLNRSINRSISQSIPRSINRSIPQSILPSINQSFVRACSVGNGVGTGGRCLRACRAHTSFMEGTSFGTGGLFLRLLFHQQRAGWAYQEISSFIVTFIYWGGSLYWGGSIRSFHTQYLTPYLV